MYNFVPMIRVLLPLFLLATLACNTGKNGTGNANLSDCIDNSRTNLRSCPDVVEPVCACDGKTYTNECIAWNAGMKTWTKGVCPPEGCIDKSKIDPAGVCASIYAPVCGCNGKLYANECEARKKGVTSWVDGECNQ